MAEREEDFIEHIKRVEEGIQFDRRTYHEVMKDEKASKMAKVIAAKADVEAQLYLIRFLNEAQTFVRSMKTNNRVIPFAQSQIGADNVVIQ